MKNGSKNKLLFGFLGNITKQVSDSPNRLIELGVFAKIIKDG